MMPLALPKTNSFIRQTNQLRAQSHRPPLNVISTGIATHKPSQYLRTCQASMPTKPMCCRFTGPHCFGKWMLRCAVNGLNLLKTQFRCVLVLSQVAFAALRPNSIETILFLILGRARIHCCPIRRSSCGQRGKRCRLYEFVLQAS